MRPQARSTIKGLRPKIGNIGHKKEPLFMGFGICEMQRERAPLWSDSERPNPLDA